MLKLVDYIRAKLETGARISDAEALALFESDDLLAVGGGPIASSASVSVPEAWANTEESKPRW